MTVEHELSGDTTKAPASEPEPTRPDATLLIKTYTRRFLARWPLILLTALVIAAIGLAAGLFFGQYRFDRQIDDAARQQAIKAASDGAVALLSYSPDNLNHDFEKAKSHLTGDFLAYYDKFSEQLVAPAAQHMQITQTAKVVRAAVSELHPDSAVILVFLDQTTLSKEKPKPLVTPSGVRVTLNKVKGSWLIAKFEPL
jgi:Mce-associated membrane protein